MITLVFVPFAAAFVLVQLSDRRALRLGFAILTLVAMAVSGFMFGLSRFYERGYIAAAVESLASKAPAGERAMLLEASKEFRRTFRSESPFSLVASAQLWSKIQQVNPAESKDSDQAVAPIRSLPPSQKSKSPVRGLED